MFNEWIGGKPRFYCVNDYDPKTVEGEQEKRWADLLRAKS